jgi:hypothetical protein
VSSPAIAGLHRRSVSIETAETEYEGFPALFLHGRLTGERPEQDGVRVVHDMRLDLTVRLSDSTIVCADAHMGSFPHAECPFVAPSYRDLVGLSIARGYTRSLRQAFGGTAGCAHLYELARAIGAVLMQGRAAHSAARRAAADIPTLASAARLLSLRGTCHVWAPDGVGEQKVAAGWRPTPSEYPAPPLQQILTEEPS